MMTPIEDISLKYGTDIALILLCCRLHFKTVSDSTLQQFINNNAIDWDHVRKLSAYHRIEPMVYKALAAFDIPDETAALGKRRQLVLVQQSFKRALETERIIYMLAERGIKCIVYKGVAFSKQFYGDLISRESSDIDLVISPDDFDKVLEIMNGDGYSFQQQLERDFFEDELFNRKKDLCFNKYEGGVRAFHIEFHWRISDNALQIKRHANALLFDSGVKVMLAKSYINTLNKNAHYLSVLIHHSNNDALSILRNIADLGQIVSNVSDMDVGYLKKSIADLNLKRASTLCGALSADLLGIVLPFCSKGTTGISAKVKNHFIERLLKKEWIGDHFEVKLFSKSIFFLKDNPGEKIKYLIACLGLRFTPSVKDLRLFKLPKPLYFLYPILKPFRSVFSPSTNAEEKELLMRNSEKSNN